MEQELPAGLGEGQVAEFVEDDEVAAYELICGAALRPARSSASRWLTMSTTL